MPKTDIATIAGKMYQLLEPLTSDERVRAVQATMILFGDTTVPARSGDTAKPPMHGALLTSPGAFMDTKAPANKGELLAAAARYREMAQREEAHSKADLKKVVTDARRNFDDKNYVDDMKNARKRGLFNLGTGRDANTLSYYGQQLIDALPDREAAAKLKKPKLRRGGKKGNKV